MKVKTEVEEDNSEQAIWTDITGVFWLSYLAQIYRWPAHPYLIDHLQKCKKLNVGYEELRQVYPEWRPHLYVRHQNTLKAWLLHYAQYEFLRPGFGGDENESEIAQFQSWLHTEMSVMLAVPQPTEYEKILEKKRLDNMAIRERLRKDGSKKASPSISVSESSVRRLTKEQKILREPTPPSFVIKDTSHLRKPPGMGPALDQVSRNCAICCPSIPFSVMIILGIANGRQVF